MRDTIRLLSGLENPRRLSYNGSIITPYDFSDDMLLSGSSPLLKEMPEYRIWENGTPIERASAFLEAREPQSMILRAEEFAEMIREAWRRREDDLYKNLVRELIGEPDYQGDPKTPQGPYTHVAGTTLKFYWKSKSSQNLEKFLVTVQGYRNGRPEVIGNGTAAPSGYVRVLNKGLPEETSEEKVPVENPGYEGLYWKWSAEDDPVGREILIKYRVFFLEDYGIVLMSGDHRNSSPCNRLANESFFVASLK
ncbi:MAG: hypothetical protein HYX24_05880 [Candidatus Aenigmarchaeota archaeon]|nr:hypothetical protein [Candidatus Aenigmarchaeota archaeon]